MKIRPAKAEDAAQVLEISKEVNRFLASRRPEVGEFKNPLGFYPQAIKEKLIFVAEEGGLVVGYVLAVINEKPDDLSRFPHLNVDELAVAKEFQGSGVGKALMEEIQRWAKEKGLKSIRLSVWEFNPIAIRFYEKLGYKAVQWEMEKTLG